MTEREILDKAAAIVKARSLRRGRCIDGPSTSRPYLTTILQRHRTEVFACLYLDNRHRIIEYIEHFFGTVDGASVHPRVIVAKALELNASALIVAHNHPSGVAEPSRADRAITTRLSEALALVDVRIIDHIVVGDDATTSFAERGWL